LDGNEGLLPQAAAPRREATQGVHHKVRAISLTSKNSS